MSFSIEASNTVAVVERLATDAVKAIQPLADELGMAAKYVFELFVRQNYVYAAQAGMWMLALIAFSFFAWRWVRKILKKEKYQFLKAGYYSDVMTWDGFCVLIGTICIVIALVVSMILASTEVVPRVLNPHYYAIKDMVEMGQTLVPTNTPPN